MHVYVNPVLTKPINIAKPSASPGWKVAQQGLSRSVTPYVR